jgi:hypothetical protein
LLHLLDANVLIDANRDYYPIRCVPEFWGWLVDRATRQQTKIPLETYEEEILQGNEDHLTRWVKDNGATPLLDENVDVGLVAHVMESGYAADPNDEEVQRLGRDPFPIAYALCDPARRLVVTTEVSKPTWKRANRRIPDGCRDLGMHCRNTFEFIEALDFTTGWRR